MSTDTAPGVRLSDKPAGGAPRGRSRLAGVAWPTYLLLAVLAVVYIFPFLVQIATSFKTEPEAAANPLGLIPQNWTIAAYERLFQFSDFLLWSTNSLIV